MSIFTVSKYSLCMLGRSYTLCILTHNEVLDINLKIDFQIPRYQEMKKH
jgi:hypothetical protein